MIKDKQIFYENITDTSKTLAIIIFYRIALDKYKVYYNNHFIKNVRR